MIQSMTGFGKAEGQLDSKKVTIQLKSLNSKQSDVTVKVPNSFKEKELSYRKILAEQLSRGKVEMYLSYEAVESTASYTIDKELFISYFNQLVELQNNLKTDSGDLFASILRLPEVVKNNEEELEANEWKKVEEILNEAIGNLIEFRQEEGKSLENDLKSHIGAIEKLLQEALKFDAERTETVRERLRANLDDLEQKEKVNEDRFEQEMIYYLEKYDISEEKVRLKTHCDYFKKTMSENKGQGKKLGFISQEIGREINTLGSKANHAEMQKLVVQMKDHLEKIKEQVLNVL
ncbi:MAG: YicC/YloC family endoribonuclease [Vicingaceae bacterium]